MIDGFALHEVIGDNDEKPVDYRFLDVNPAFEKLTDRNRLRKNGKNRFPRERDHFTGRG